MNNIVGDLMITPGDKNFLPSNTIVITFGLRFCLYHRQVRAGTGLSQVHGAGPLATVHFLKIGLFQVITAVGRNGQSGATAQKRCQGKSHIGAIPHLTTCGAVKLW